MRTTLELLELLKKCSTLDCRPLTTMDILFIKNVITKSEYIVLFTFMRKNYLSLDSNTARYAWLDAQIEKLKQEVK